VSNTDIDEPVVRGLQRIILVTQLVRKNMVINEHEKLSNVALRQKLQ